MRAALFGLESPQYNFIKILEKITNRMRLSVIIINERDEIKYYEIGII